MKCPYRKKVIKENIYGEGNKIGKVIKSITQEEYEECHYRDCPCYNNGDCSRAEDGEI